MAWIFLKFQYWSEFHFRPSTYSAPKSIDSNKYGNAKAISSADLFGDDPIGGSGDTPSSKLDKFKAYVPIYQFNTGVNLANLKDKMVYKSLGFS